MSKNTRNNITGLYLIKFAKWFNLVMPVMVVFYQRNGLDMQSIFWLKSVYSSAIVIMEVPSGYMADIWGRKRTLLLGGILGAAGFALYSFSYGFWAFAVAEVVLGVGQSFISGADTAMLYDTLKAANREKEYIKQEGWITSTGNFSEAIAGVCGGLLAALSLRMPFYFQFAVASTAIPGTLLLKEPKIQSTELTKSFRTTLLTIKETFYHTKLRAALLVASFTGTASLTFAWFVQPYFQEAGLPLSLFGIMWTLLNLTVGVSSIFSFKVERRLGGKNTLMFIVAGLSLGYFLSAWKISFAGISALFGFYVVRGIAHPILKDYINQYTKSEVRATILSLRDLLIRINFAIIGPFLGYFTDHYSLRTALIIAGISYLVTTVAGAIPLLDIKTKRSAEGRHKP